MTCKKRAQQKKLSSLPFVSNRIIHISPEVKVGWVRRITLSFVTFVMLPRAFLFPRQGIFAA